MKRSASSFRHDLQGNSRSIEVTRFTTNLSHITDTCLYSYRTANDLEHVLKMWLDFSRCDLPSDCSATVLYVICCKYRTETSPTLRSCSSARRAVWTRVAFWRSLYSVEDCGTLCLDCCVTLATTPLALDILVSVAQLVARWTHDRKVVGSIPTNAVCFTVVR